ncbi:kinesin-like protein KIF20A [Aphidius gifuensis]|uniref:kinesin-like protein KIF20A n=1 Tax=Aphidius gifuensis TaxID=684658 RepID=UPI001CDC4559|nr:kinesin-like protein KIF20A [Aphidius gifuensis]
MNETKEDASKEETLMDPIRPSDGSIMSRENMSYLYGRDPSILAYGHRPIISKESKINLLSVYESEESICHDSVASLDAETLSSQTVKVYLRMKPFPSKLKITKELEDAYKIINQTTLLTKLPCFDNTSVSMKKNSVDTVTRKFTFTETFGPETTQLAIFEQAMKPMLIKFLSGQNCTAMTYGTTNSGKSYTLQGTSARPGIIPRSLEYVFANINPRLTPCYKPMYNCDVVNLSSIERLQELEFKQKLLSFNIPDKIQYINAYKEMQKKLEEESPVRTSQSTDAQYIVWVSFTEIYNETIYDLLSNDCQKRRPPLKLATDHHGRPFIKGLKQICVNSGSEAYQVLMAGQYNLKVAATALNARSSRSHCIFKITVLKYYIENSPDTVEISQFSFCDLAGSERLKKTLNVGDRLKEAQNINTSLMVFGRCLKSIYDGQCIKQRNEHTGPFRDSKLTRLFQNALSGKEYMALVVNINPIPNLYIETQNVLNLAAIAKKIVIEPKKIKRKKNTSRFSLVVEQTQKTTTDWDDKTELLSIAESASEYDDNDEEEDEDDDNNDDDDNDISITQEDYEYLMDENNKLKKEISSLKASFLQKDMNIREEMANLHSAMMAKLEANYMNRIKEAEQQQEDAIEWSVNQVEEYYKQKINALKSRKRKRTIDLDNNEQDDDDDDSETDDDNDDEDANNNNKKDNIIINELKIDNERLNEKLIAMKTANKDLRKEKDQIEVEKNTLSYELGIIKKDLENSKLLIESFQKDNVNNSETNSYINELKKQLEQLQDKNKYLKQILNEAKNDYINITNDGHQKDIKISELESIVLLSNEKIGELQNMSNDIEALYDKKCKENIVLERKLNLQYEKIKELQKQSNLSFNLTQNNTNDISNIKIKQEILSPSSLGNNNRTVFIDNQEQPSSSSSPPSSPVDQQQIIAQLEEKLTNFEAENVALYEKLNAKSIEVESLKNDMLSTKDCLTKVTKDLDDLKKNNFNNDKSDNINNECQTSFSNVKLDISHHDKSIQSSQNVDDEEYEQLRKDFDKIQISYDTLNNQYSIESTRLKNISEDNQKLMESISNLKALLSSNELQIDTLTKDLTASRAVNSDLENKLKQMKQNEIDLEEQIAFLKDKIKEMNIEVEQLQLNAKLHEEELNKKINDLSAVCEKEHLPLISELEDKLLQLQDLNNSADRLLLEEKIENLEQQIQETKNLKNDVDALHHIIDNYEKKITSLKVQLDEAKKKEADNEIEIKRLEANCKDSITLKLKNEELICMEQESKRLEKESKILLKDLKSAEREKTYNEKLNTKQNYLKRFIFTAPSADRGRRNRREKDDNTSDDESIAPRRTKRTVKKPAKYNNDDQNSDMSVVELSGSETKRVTRRCLAQAQVCPSTEKSKTRSKKKLFTNHDDHDADIQNDDDDDDEISVATRPGLRSRKR